MDTATLTRVVELYMHAHGYTELNQLDIRHFLNWVEQQPAPPWRPMSEAPRDRSAVLLQMKSKDEVPSRPDYKFEGVVFVGKWLGRYMEWTFAAPVGCGGIPDDWIRGWQPLPPIACEHEWWTDSDGDHYCTKCPAVLHQTVDD